jgi:hypothetical protein
MMFAKRLRQGIREGRITCTIRIWQRPHVKVGGVYGRKWRPIRMPSSIIRLPVTQQGNPDWDFMEGYMKKLPYSSQLR